MKNAIAKLAMMASIMGGPSILGYPEPMDIQPYKGRDKNVNGKFTVDLKPNRKRSKPNTFKKSKRAKNKTQYSKN